MKLHMFFRDQYLLFNTNLADASMSSPPVTTLIIGLGNQPDAVSTTMCDCQTMNFRIYKPTYVTEGLDFRNIGHFRGTESSFSNILKIEKNKGFIYLFSSCSEFNIQRWKSTKFIIGSCLLLRS